MKTEGLRRVEVKPGITPVKWLPLQLNRKDKKIQRGRGKDFTGQTEVSIKSLGIALICIYDGFNRGLYFI